MREPCFSVGRPIYVSPKLHLVFIFSLIWCMQIFCFLERSIVLPLPFILTDSHLDGVSCFSSALFLLLRVLFFSQLTFSSHSCLDFITQQ